MASAETDGREITARAFLASHDPHMQPVVEFGSPNKESKRGNKRVLEGICQLSPI